MIKVAILGHGVVGSGVAEVLSKNAKSIAKKAGDDISVEKILDLREFPDSPLADKFTKDIDEILDDKSIQIVVETMGGLRPAYDFVKSALEKGKSVVTSNKELVSVKGDELLEIAAKNNVNFLFEASVGGGIPILRPLDQCLAANEVHVINGILNGTTNFILDNMLNRGMGFEAALSEAQELGYAEKDPSADVDGVDTCRKISILGSLAFGYHINPDDISTEGIRNVSLDDVSYAEAFGGTIKLIGYIKKLDDDTVTAFVAPMVVQNGNMLADINGVFNGIMIKGDAIGDVLFYGRGAGKLPTASAVVADIIDIANHLENRKRLFWHPEKPSYVSDSSSFKSDWMLRFKCDDRSVFEDALKNKNISFEVVDKVVSGEIGVVVSDMSANEINVLESALTNELISKYRVVEASES